MDKALYRRVQEVFDACVDLPPDKRRRAVLHMTADAPDVRREVLLMIEEDARQESLDASSEGRPLWLPAGVAATLQAMDGGPSVRPGDVIQGHRVVASLGRGSAADVFEVERVDSGERFALKVLRQEAPELRRRLAQEGEVLARLDHPNLVRVTEIVEVDGGIALVMDLVEGPSLHDLLEAGRPGSRAAGAICAGLLAGVAAAHRAGVIHRDLKPANVLLGGRAPAWIPRVVDFGLAASSGPAALRFTADHVAMGTPGYMAPEQFRDARTAGPPADVFSLGCILYEVLTGEPSFTGTGLMQCYHQAEVGEWRPLAEVDPSVPEAVAALVERALSPHASRRFTDAGAMHEAWQSATG